MSHLRLAREVVGIAALVWVLAASPITCSAQVTSQPADRSSDAAIVVSFSPAPQRDGMNASGNEAGTQWGESMRASTWVGPPDASFIASFAAAPQQQDATNVSGNAACPQGDDTATTSAQSTCVRQYKTLRYDEDYSFLKDPSKCCDCWDPVKYIPLFGCDSGHYLTIGGELRERYEFFRNENAGAAPADSHGNNNDFTERYMLNADLHLGQYFRVFTDFMSGEEDGRIGGARPGIDRDAFDIHQGFFDLVLPVADGNGNDNNTLTARIGRQEMQYGSGRLIDVREGPNLRLSFDAARLLLHVDQWEIDGWWSKPVLDLPGVFDDKPDPDKALWGLYAVHPFALLPKGNIDLYYLGYENTQAVYIEGKGTEVRHTLGTRLWGAPLPWEYNVEYGWQFGTFGSGQIEAWSAANSIRYNFSDLPMKPRLGLRFDFTSGSSSPTSSTLGTFNPLFPSGVYFNLLNPVGPLNLIDLHPVLDLYASETVTFSFDWDFFWRESLGDGVYSLGGMPERPGVSGGRYVGNSPSLTAAWNPTRHLTLLASYVHFFPGSFFESNPPDKQTDYFTTWLSYKF
jgi:alginate export protein